MPHLSPADHLTELRRELARLDTVAAQINSSGWSSAVPACPGWDVAGLFRHLGGVHRNITQAIRTGNAPKPAHQTPQDPAELSEWLRVGGQDLLTALDADPSAPAWTFDPQDQSVGFWRCRMALETALHRVDAEVALGVRTPVPAKLAADGVSEAIEVMARLGVAEGRLHLPDYAIELNATDTGDAWQLGRGNVVGTASGGAEYLLLACWRRIVPGRSLTLDGDASKVSHLLGLPITP